MSLSPKTIPKVQLGLRYILLLLSLISAPALGNGVTVWDGDMPEDGLLIIPAEPQAFEPFTVVFTVEVPPGATDHHAVHVDVIDHDALNNKMQITEGVTNEVIITHHGNASASGANGLLPLAVEIQGLPPGNLILKSVALDNAGNTSVINEKDLVIAEGIDTHEVFIMISPDRNRFFMTASEEERDAMTSRGPDGVRPWSWARDEYFHGWPVQGPAPEAAVPVCRFYSAQSNAYFITADEAECQALQSLESGWDFGGVQFRALAPNAGGACPAGTEPVWRIYRDREDPQERSHRFTMLPWVYDRLLGEDWAGEGIAFCTKRQESYLRDVRDMIIAPSFLTDQVAASVILSVTGEASNIGVTRNKSQITLEADVDGHGPYTRETVGLGQLEPGDYSIRHVGLWSYGFQSPEFITFSTEEFTVYEAIPTTKAHTFFHPGINHYLVTAGEFERQAVLADGWHATDSGFNVWSADGPAPRQAVPVCRFYSSLVNSHFYTASESECDYLQSFDSGWLYEGIAFQALVPRDDGVCPAGTQPVWRLFNNRHDQLDSNHRFVVGSETYRIMVADGWAGEGVAFCSPPASGPGAGQTPIGFVPG